MQIHEFQEMMRRIYFHRDSQRGFSGTYGWLVEEVEELGAALKEQNRKAMMNEFADVLAWLASLASVVNIDLETVAISKYNRECPKCQRAPCECPDSKKHSSQPAAIVPRKSTNLSVKDEVSASKKG